MSSIIWSVCVPHGVPMQCFRAPQYCLVGTLPQYPYGGRHVFDEGCLLRLAQPQVTPCFSELTTSVRLPQQQR